MGGARGFTLSQNLLLYLLTLMWAGVGLAWRASWAPNSSLKGLLPLGHEQGEERKREKGSSWKLERACKRARELGALEVVWQGRVHPLL